MKHLWNLWRQALPALKFFVNREMSPSIISQLCTFGPSALPELAIPSTVRRLAVGTPPCGLTNTRPGFRAGLLLHSLCMSASVSLHKGRNL